MSATATAPVRRPDSANASWRLSDRLGLGLAWLLGLLFCAIAAAIVIYFLVEGIRYLRPSLLVTNPVASASESQTGGFLDPLLGTLILGTMAMAIAVPVGIGIAVWLSEFGRPTWLAGYKPSVNPHFEIRLGTQYRGRNWFNVSIMDYSYKQRRRLARASTSDAGQPSAHQQSVARFYHVCSGRVIVQRVSCPAPVLETPTRPKLA